MFTLKLQLLKLKYLQMWLCEQLDKKLLAIASFLNLTEGKHIGEVLEAISGLQWLQPGCRTNLSFPLSALTVLTPACNVQVRHSPLAYLFSAALGVHRECLNLKQFHSYFLTKTSIQVFNFSQSSCKASLWAIGPSFVVNEIADIEISFMMPVGLWL
jgi:hypothetical protein